MRGKISAIKVKCKHPSYFFQMLKLLLPFFIVKVFPFHTKIPDVFLGSTMLILHFPLSNTYLA